MNHTRQTETMGPTVRRQCPICDWHMNEPPPEIQTEQRADGGITLRVRQQSVVPAGLFHILTSHPSTECAAMVRAECGIPEGTEIATAYGRIVAAVEGELRDAVRAVRRQVWS